MPSKQARNYQAAYQAARYAALKTIQREYPNVWREVWAKAAAEHGIKPRESTEEKELKLLHKLAKKYGVELQAG